MRKLRFIFLLLIVYFPMWGQIDKKEVRRGNREFKKENYEAAFQDYLRAVGKDTSSIAANYNMASALYRMEQYDQAQQALDRIKESAPSSASAADYLYNLGDVALQRKDYQAAVKAFGESLILRPDDLDAKENFIYARKMLQNQQQNDQNQNSNDQNQNNNDQNQDNNGQNQDQNKNEDQNQENDQNDQDRQNDQNKDNQQENQNQQQNDKPQNQEGQPQNQEAQITPQAAQQMLQAIQAKEKETQDKVNKKKAMALKSRQKDKNW